MKTVSPCCPVGGRGPFKAVKTPVFSSSLLPPNPLLSDREDLSSAVVETASSQLWFVLIRLTCSIVALAKKIVNDNDLLRNQGWD